MAEFPAMPLWTDAYLGDTTHLTTTEHGAYLLLLISMWRTADKRLPNDDRLLARYARCTAGQWARMKPILMRFFKSADGYITQSRLTDEANAVKRNSRKQSNKAKARWLKTKGSEDAAAMPEPCRNDASLTLTHTHTVEPKSGSTVVGTRKRASPKTRITPDAQISERMRAAAAERGLSDAEAEAQFAKFRDWALAKGQAYADWDAAWRNWLTSPHFAPVLGAVHPFPSKGRATDGERLDDHLDALKARLAVQRLE